MRHYPIAKTLCSDTRRYQFETRFKVVDIGLRLTDVEALDLADSAEPVFLGKGNKNNRRASLRAAGATLAEIAFLLDDDNPLADSHHGKRVELNAMNSRQFVDFIERKLIGARARKVVPVKADLDDAYRLFIRGDRVMKAARQTIKAIGDQPVAVPRDLKAQVQGYLAEHPTASLLTTRPAHPPSRTSIRRRRLRRTFGLRLSAWPRAWGILPRSVVSAMSIRRF